MCVYALNKSAHQLFRPGSPRSTIKTNPRGARERQQHKHVIACEGVPCGNGRKGCLLMRSADRMRDRAAADPSACELLEAR